MKAHLITAGLILAWMVTPESLMLLGRASGISGITVIIALFLGVILAVLTATLIHHPRLAEGKSGSDVAVLSQVYGQAPAMAIILSARIPMLLFAATGMLVTAGFAFNEIFVYWFPNFLFASLLLLFIGLINVFTEKVALWIQVFSVGIVVLALMALIVMGSGGGEQSFVGTDVFPGDLSLSLIGMAFLAFLGFDFYERKENGNVSLAIILALAFLLLAGWVILSLGHVETSRLAESTIPYLLVAREVGGEAGRYVMGIIIIFGALSGVNALFFVVRRTMKNLAGNKSLPVKVGRSWPVVIVSAIIIEAMMMSGFAGEEILETQLRASLLLWLLYLGLRSFASGLRLSIEGTGGRIYGTFLGGIYLLLVCSLALPDQHIGYILRFSGVWLCGLLLFSFVWTKFYGKVSLK